MIDLNGTAFLIAAPRDRHSADALLGIPGAKWDGRKSIWRVPLQCASFVREFAQVHRLQVTTQAQDAIERMHPPYLQPVSLPDLDAPLRNGRQLFAHQKTGIKFLTSRRHAILADQMGLGKTTTALIASAALNIPIHVICPASLRENWTREAQDLGIMIYTHSWAKIPAPPAHRYLLIADEAHYAQSGTQSQRGKAFLALAKAAEAVFVLTGTPMKNGRPINLYPLLQAVRSPLAVSKKWYEQRYCNARPSKWSRWDTTGASRLPELSKRIAPVMLRRMKTECLDLPEKIRVIRQAEKTAEASRQYTEALDSAVARSKAKAPSGVLDTLVMFTIRRMAASAAKVDTAVAISQEILEQGGQVVLFTSYLATARRLEAAFPGSALLIGETPPIERQALVDDFQAGRRRVFVTTFGAGGVGITLTRAQTVILVDRPWTPGDCYQAEDRIHRIGQVGASVLSIWLQWDEIDVAIDQLLEQKTERIDVVMAGKRRTITAGMSMQQVADLLA